MKTLRLVLWIAVALVAAPLGVFEVRRDATDASIEEKQEDEQQARRAWGGTGGRKGHVYGRLWLDLTIPDFNGRRLGPAKI